jgi:GNAT superfamily N-acetyltransferase
VSYRTLDTYLVVCTGGARSREARQLVRIMEAEFLSGRSGGLARFYPDVFTSRGTGRLYGLVDTKGEVVATLGARLARIRTDNRRLTAALIGFVVTAPAHRGRGLGQRLMAMTAQHLTDAGVDLGVLWTRRHDLYLKCGWQVADPSLIGRWRGGTSAAISATWTKAPFAPAQRRRLNRLRPQPALERPYVIYDKIPYPAECLWVATAPSAYVLLGEKDEAVHALEWAGDPDRVTGLLGAAARRWPDLTLRGFASDAVSLSLGRSGLVAFDPEPAGMWISLARRFRKRDAIWIPRLDRI